MDLEAAGRTVFEGNVAVSGARLADLTRALGPSASDETAGLVTFFGPTVAGDERFVKALGLDLSRALLGGISYEWRRPMRKGDDVHVKMAVDTVQERGNNTFARVVTEFSDAGGKLISRQSATFIERSGAPS
jgi:hypothetical protein